MSERRENPTRRDMLRAAAGLPAIGALGLASGDRLLEVPPAEAGKTGLAKVKVRPSDARGHADHGWLDTYHTFSFADYHDPDFVQFGALRVINQDRVAGGRGFPMHGHRDMEIVSYVLEGALEHKDTMGNGSRIRPGDVQLMSAGRGVQHSEFNARPSKEVHFLQMWVHPKRKKTEPRYEQRNFTREERSGALRLVVSPDGAEGSLTIGQDARLFAALFKDGDAARHELEKGRLGWLHVATGAVAVNGVALGPGDGAALTGTGGVELRGLGDAELVLWDVPA